MYKRQKTCGSFLRFPGEKEIGVEFNSLSKTYGLAGARIGFCFGNSQVVARLKLLKSNMDYGMFLPIQAAAIAAITQFLLQRCHPNSSEQILQHPHPVLPIILLV